MLNLKKLNDEIPSEDINYVYEFVNSHSHLDSKQGLIQFDPTLTVSGRDSIKKALSLIELADNAHYKAMKKAVGVT